MEHINISKITESDFDSIIENAGGKRVSRDHTKETKLNCDYKLHGSLIELKLIEENPSDKNVKQNKLADLFARKGKTIVIDPSTLNDKNKYYKILETPIKTALKKSSKQLQQTSSSIECNVRITIIINNGLSLMTDKEFEDVAIKCAKNDTSGIDILMIGGCYYYSDKFDTFTFFPFKEINLRKQNDIIVNKIKDSWFEFLNNYMTRNIIETNIKRDKIPVLDISFELGETLYVKPAPNWGKKSEFWPEGIRPREDTTGLNICPPLATVLPKFNNVTYEQARNKITDNGKLKDSLFSYNNWVEEVVKKGQNLLQPILAIELSEIPPQANSFQDLCVYAVAVFQKEVPKIIDHASEYTESHQSLNYILLVCEEIGIDIANDISWISHERELPGIESSERIIEGERIKFEYAIAVAATYCIQKEANCVYYKKDNKYKWV